MATPVLVKREATYQDLLAVPETQVAEIVDGELYASPRPAVPHARASAAIHGSLHGPFDAGSNGPGGWWLLFEPELHLGRDILVPDLAGWRRERLPRLPNTAALTVAPDWVCEVVSPSSVRLDRARKLPVYARHEVRHAWLVDPLARSLDVFRREAALWVLLATFVGDDRVRAEPFEAIDLALGLLWPEPEPPAG